MIQLENADRTHIGNMKAGLKRNLEKQEDMQRKEDNSLIYLCGAEMDIKTAPVITKRLSYIAQNGLYGYTLQDEEYNNAIIEWMKRTRRIDVVPEAIIPTHGTVFSLITTLKAFTNEGDGVIIQSPSYYRFDRAIRNHGRKIVYNPLIDRGVEYELNFTELEQQCRDPANKILLLCNPHNPTGKVFKRHDLEKIYQLVAENDLILFVDEIFGEMTFGDDEFCSILTVGEKNVILSTSLGKAFNFTGVNHANMIIPDTEVRTKYRQQHTLDHFGSIDPFFYNGLIAAYTDEGYEWLEEVKQLVYGNYLYIREYCEKNIPVITPYKLEGGFICWIDFRKLSMSASELEHFLLYEAHAAGDPGNEYGPMGEGFFRFQIAAERTNIEKMMIQLKAAIDKLQNISG